LAVKIIDGFRTGSNGNRIAVAMEGCVAKTAPRPLNSTHLNGRFAHLGKNSAWRHREPV
jgi:hypothetical protein